MLNQLENELAKIVTGYWSRFNRPILLSLLGETLTFEAQQEKQSTGKSLADIIRNNMSGKLRIVSVPRHGSGVVPYDETQGLSDEELVVGVPPPRVQDHDPIGESSHIIQKEIWMLFRRGAAKDKAVFVEIPPFGPLIVHQIDEKDSASSQWIEVSADDLPVSASEAGGASPHEAGSAIRAWAEKNSIPMDRIQRQRDIFSSPIRNPKIESARQASLASFVTGMAWLEPSELARIFIPADIVVNLIARAGFKG